MTEQTETLKTADGQTSDLTVMLGMDNMDFRRSFPDCCSGCKHLGSDWNEWADTTAWYCERNIFFPWKKNSCVRRELKGVLVMPNYQANQPAEPG